jgi:hypothetical protein
MKKNLSIYLIAASIIIGSVIISKAITSSSNNTCFNIVYKSLYEKPKPKEKDVMVLATLASRICKGDR